MNRLRLGEGNGGNVVVCRSDGHETVELLDFYEAKAISGFKIADRSGSVEEQIQTIQEKIDNATRDPLDPTSINVIGIGDPVLPLTHVYQELLKKMVFLPSDVGLKALADSNEDITVPKNCRVERLALFKEGKLLVTKWWQKLSNTRKPAHLPTKLSTNSCRNLGNLTWILVVHDDM